MSSVSTASSKCNSNLGERHGPAKRLRLLELR